MPETAPWIGEAIIRSAAIVLCLGVAYSFGAVHAARKLDGRLVSLGWLVLTVAAASAMSWGTQQALGESFLSWLLVAWPMIGIPTGLATLTAWKAARRPERRSAMRDVLIALAVFVVSIPLGAIVSAVPDFLRVMSR
ncbi:MAG: hypothetical protein MJB57_10060 [Gemmatimonadetes bacterium]|nr:hypothetical protein [Gemmatimonadota bacterium]